MQLPFTYFRLAKCHCQSQEQRHTFLKMNSYKPRSLIYTIFTKAQCYIVVFILTPGIFIFQMTVVFPNLVAIFEVGIAKQILHISLATFCFINVIGNMIFSIIMDSSLKRTISGDGTFCEYCRMLRPAKSWHCRKCNVCILKRDHHCTFIARCIGLHNQRYFILFLGYVMTSMAYATYYNYYYVASKFEDHGWILSAFRILNPLLRFMIPEPMGIKDMYVLYLFMNVGLVFWSGSLFFYHFRNIVMGVTSYESKFPQLMDSSNWKENLLNVFGTKWYVAILWPLCDSPLPDTMKVEWTVNRLIETFLKKIHL